MDRAELAKRIRAARRVLSPQRRKAAAREAIARAIVEIEYEQNHSPRRNIKKAKTAATQLRAALKRSQNAANALAKLDESWLMFPLDLSEEIERVEAKLAALQTPKVPTRSRQRHAVSAARSLISEYCGENEPLPKSRNSKLHRLSAILYGEPDHPNILHNEIMKITGTKQGPK